MRRTHRRLLWVTGLLATAATAWCRDIVIVAADGSGDFTSIQAAVTGVSGSAAEPAVIAIRPGIYRERVVLQRGQHHLVLIGTGRDRRQVVLTAGAGEPVLRASADDLLIQNLTIENTAGATAGQQLAAYLDGQRQRFENVLLLGWQDTLAVWNGAVAYFHDCDIWGSVDFIYSGGTALFDHCTLTQRRSTGGPLTAPSTPADVPYGLVFLDCHITRTPNVTDDSSTLMRPWRDHGMSAFLRCVMDEHISPAGWSPWGGREATCRAIEYASRGPDGLPLSMAQRAPWVHILTDEEAAAYTPTAILGGWDPNDAPDPGPVPVGSRPTLSELLAQRPAGAASLAGGTSGGAGGEIVTATDLEQLRDYAGRTEPLVILIDRPLVAGSSGMISVASDKTIIGTTSEAALLAAGLSLSNARNVVIRYLTIRDNTLVGDYDGKANDFDAVALRNSHHVWIDHCHLSRAGDGLLDMTLGSGYVTVSWTVLSFHNKTCAVTGRSDGPSSFTLDHCWFNNTVQRNLAVTDGQVHAVNCLFTGLRGYGMNARAGTSILLEACVFRDSHNPFYGDAGGQVEAVDCWVQNCTGRAEEAPMAWRPAAPLPVDPVDQVAVQVVLGAGPNGQACPGGLSRLGIDFRPAEKTESYGYVPDTGGRYREVLGGLSYGWSRDHGGQSFWRRTLSTKDDRTLVPVEADSRRNGGITFLPGAHWELAVAPGLYDLWIVCGDGGDPRNPSDVQSNPPRVNHLLVEGHRFEDPDGALPSDYDEIRTQVEILDGRLTLAAAADSVSPAVCFLEIQPLAVDTNDPFATVPAGGSGRPPHR